MTSHLELKSISMQFEDNHVLENINLLCERGSFTTLLGPSGSGKSTIFNIIGGLLQPTAGQVLLNGKDITHQRGNISFMPQTHSLMPWRTVIENIELGQEISGTFNREKTNQLLVRSGFMQIKDQMPDTLSGGMKQRVSFLRALNSESDILLLDEPFSALDEITRVEMQQWLKEILKTEERTVLMISHSIEEAIKLSDTIVVLEGKPATIHRSYQTHDLQSDEDIVQLKRQLIELLSRK